MIAALEWWPLVVTVVIAGIVSYYFPDREGEPDNSWVHTDLDSVPYVITQPEPRGHVLPWYRRVFTRPAKIESDPTPPITYRS